MVEVIPAGFKVAGLVQWLGFLVSNTPAELRLRRSPPPSRVPGTAKTSTKQCRIIYNQCQPHRPPALFLNLRQHHRRRRPL